jgi:hypothetical protein
MIVAINIKTEVWNAIITLMTNRGWLITYKYDEFDAGIDFDFVVLEKNGEEILLGWDNWVEGEIKCSEKLMREIESLVNVRFFLGEPVNLNPEVIKRYKKDKL